MTDEEIDQIIIALNMRINHIQTGNVLLSANDAIESKQSKLLKVLEPSQEESIERIRRLIAHLKRWGNHG